MFGAKERASAKFDQLKGFLGELHSTIDRSQLLMVASSLAYTTILSIIPALAVSFAIFQAFGGLDKVYATLEPLIVSNLAQGVSDEVSEKIRGFIANAHGSAIGLGGLVGLIVTSMSMLSSAERALNTIWGIKLRRTLFQRVSSYWLFITLGPLALAVGIGAASSADGSISWLFPSGTGLFLLAIGFFYLIFKYVPHCFVDWRPALFSAVTTAAVSVLAKLGYQVYTSRVLTYSKIYGSLGAIPILLLWIYINWVIILLGAAFGVVLQKRIFGTAHPDRPRSVPAAK